MTFESVAVISKDMTNQQRYSRPILSRNPGAEIPMRRSVSTDRVTVTDINTDIDKWQNVFYFSFK